MCRYTAACHATIVRPTHQVCTRVSTAATRRPCWRQRMCLLCHRLQACSQSTRTPTRRTRPPPNSHHCDDNHPGPSAQLKKAHPAAGVTPLAVATAVALMLSKHLQCQAVAAKPGYVNVTDAKVSAAWRGSAATPHGAKAGAVGASPSASSSSGSVTVSEPAMKRRRRHGGAATAGTPGLPRRMSITLVPPGYDEESYELYRRFNVSECHGQYQCRHWHAVPPLLTTHTHPHRYPD